MKNKILLLVLIAVISLLTIGCKPKPTSTQLPTQLNTLQTTETPTEPADSPTAEIVE